jgi:hypothetical protein
MSNEHVNSTVRSILDTICTPVERDMRPIAEAIAPVEPVALEVSDDQNTVTVRLKAVFVEGPLCSPCIAAKDTALCAKLPCGYGTRKRADGLCGFFREVRG